MLVEIVTTAALHALKRRGGTTRQLRLLSAPVSVDETTISETIRADDMATIQALDDGSTRTSDNLACTLRAWACAPENPTSNCLSYPLILHLLNRILYRIPSAPLMDWGGRDIRF